MNRIALLLRKDVLVLRRSPLLLGILIAYPLAIALLIGLVASYGSSKPRVAFVDEDNLPATVVLGGKRFDVGHTIDEAHDALSDFIVEARQRGYRCVRAIHGKGLTSPNREPVLKGRVRKWLAHWDEVLAYCEAPPNAGGGGAVLILLRGK